MIYVEDQFGKTTSNMLPLSHSSEVITYERPTLLKVTTHIAKCDLVKIFQSSLLEVILIKGLYVIDLEFHLVKGFSNDC